MGKTFGIVALVSGIIGLTLFWLPLLPNNLLGGAEGFIPISLSAVGIICGVIGINKDDSHGMAIAGLILGSIGVGLSILFIIASLGSSAF